MFEIEHEKTLVAQWDELMAQRDGLLAENTRLEEENEQLKLDNEALQQRIDELEAAQPARPPLLYSDDFHEDPVEAPDAYAIDDAADELESAVLTADDETALKAFIDWDAPLNSAGKCKAELGPRLGDAVERYARIPFGAMRWIGLSILIPDGWDRDGSKCSVMSIHGTEDEEEQGIGRNGNLGFHIGGDRFYLWRCWSKTKTQTGNENKREVEIINPYVRGKWMRLVLQARFDWHPQNEGGVGFTKLWLDDKLVFDEVGPNAYNDDVGPYFKFGAYEASWSKPERNGKPKPSPSQHTLYFRRFRFGDERHVYEDVR